VQQGGHGVPAGGLHVQRLLRVVRECGLVKALCLGRELSLSRDEAMACRKQPAGLEKVES
jgi:hypothetical protein